MLFMKSLCYFPLLFAISSMFEMDSMVRAVATFCAIHHHHCCRQPKCQWVFIRTIFLSFVDMFVLWKPYKRGKEKKNDNNIWIEFTSTTTIFISYCAKHTLTQLHRFASLSFGISLFLRLRRKLSSPLSSCVSHSISLKLLCCWLHLIDHRYVRVCVHSHELHFIRLGKPVGWLIFRLLSNFTFQVLWCGATQADGYFRLFQ